MRLALIRFAPAVVPVIALALAGLADAAAPAAGGGPVTGTVLSVAPDALVIRTGEMLQVRVLAPPGMQVVENQPMRLADIRPDDFLGTTAAPRDGRLVASEVHVFEEAMRGTGEGHYPWSEPGSTMTNGAVATVTQGAVAGATAAQAGGGLTMTVRYKGGEQQVFVPPDTPVTRVKIVDRARLTVGAKVAVFGQVKDEHTLEANLISLTPPAARPRTAPTTHP